MGTVVAFMHLYFGLLELTETLGMKHTVRMAGITTSIVVPTLGYAYVYGDLLRAYSGVRSLSLASALLFVAVSVGSALARNRVIWARLPIVVPNLPPLRSSAFVPSMYQLPSRKSKRTWRRIGYLLHSFSVALILAMHGALTLRGKGRPVDASRHLQRRFAEDATIEHADQAIESGKGGHASIERPTAE